ncbi:MAG: heme-binding beta-barrel domain-containing protein [Gammaproteobacteria bacterium]|nr:heme-binding beta-barrel domain-containing protein [Gammaproteobacteria bacterium]
MSDLDYGPLAGLSGSWRGDKGQDESPEPDGIEKNAYTETIHFTPAGDVDNAETQELVALHYHLEVHRIPDGKAIHNQTGYWIWDSESQLVMHAFTIPRGVAVIAGGHYRGETDVDGNIVIEVEAELGHPDWQIIQSPFMQKNALTTGFSQRLTIGPARLEYSQTTLVDIYGRKSFEHTDRNLLSPL